MNKNFEFVGDSDSDDDSDYTSKTNSVDSDEHQHSIEDEKTPKYKVFTYDYLLSIIVDYSNTKK